MIFTSPVTGHDVLAYVEKSSSAGHQHKVYFACWDQHGMLFASSQHGILVDDLLVPIMGSGCAGGPA